MNKIILSLTLLLFMNTSDSIIFDFTRDANLSSWYVVDDGVMGGRSKGKLSINDNGNAIFSGEVSLDNYGGFSSIRHQFKKKDISQYSQVVLRVRGDGKKYKFRIKEKNNDYYSFITTFQSTQDWQDLILDMKDMYPAFRGRVLNMDNLKPNTIEEIAFLIGNKRAEKFLLEIDVIFLK